MVRHIEYLGLAFFSALYLLPILSQDEYVLGVLTLSFVYMVLVEATALMAGQLGYLSLAETAFWGIGAYASALFVLKMNGLFIVGFIIGGVIPSIVAYCACTQFLKVTRQAFAIVTLAFLLIVQLIAYNWMSLTNGSLGIGLIPRPSVMGIAIASPTSLYYMYLAIASVTVLFVYVLVRSRVGRAFIAIREDELLAKSVGTDCNKYKLVAFTLSGFMAGISGSLYAHYATFIGPDVLFDFYFVTIVLVMVVVGGVDDVVGVAVASVFFTVLPEFLRFSGILRDTCYGLILILVLITPKQKIRRMLAMQKE